MAIRPICDSCGKELKKFGAILFSPPSSDNTVTKFHLCQDCYKGIVDKFKNKEE